MWYDCCSDVFMKEVKYFFRRIKEKDFLISISCLLLLQSIIYFFIKFFQNNYHTINFILDNKIPFIPYFIYIYNMFYPFMFLSFYYIYCKDNTRYKNGIYAGIIGYLICNIIFVIYPTIMIRADISNINMDFLTSFVVYLTYYFDEPPLNCFPSIHVLFCLQAIYTAIMSKGIKYRYKILIVIIGFLIAISTVLVKQHYFYDMVAAIVVCTLSNLLVFIINKYLKRK